MLKGATKQPLSFKHHPLECDGVGKCTCPMDSMDYAGSGDRWYGLYNPPNGFLVPEMFGEFVNGVFWFW